ncbi:hypothetical protein [Peribacillus asahii]|uniref:hypothetical protein n=1 Tax=Peribacillus asahii TaxID=228899 RepID=UPI002079BA16|nr:hypothetical protein [Peribacillus asahii]USK62174.1 hypothetical protein LIT37_23645 [Peribacillus asahii]
MKPFDTQDHRKDSYEIYEKEVLIYQRTNTKTRTIRLSFEAIEELYKAVRENEDKLT